MIDFEEELKKFQQALRWKRQRSYLQSGSDRYDRHLKEMLKDMKGTV